MNYFLGLDLSLTSSGVVLIDNDNNILEKNIIETIATKQIITDRFNRYNTIKDKIYNIISKYNLKSISIENYSYASKGRIVQLVESGSLVRNMLLTKYPDVLIFEVAPISLKKYILGTIKSKGKSAKDIIIREIYKKYGHDIDDNNIADAFILSQISKSIFNYINNKSNNLYIYQTEVIKNIVKKQYSK